LAKLQAQAIMEGLSELEYADLLIDAPMLAELDEATAVEQTPEDRAAFDAFATGVGDEARHKIAEMKMLHGADWKRRFDAWCRGEEIEDET